MTKRRRKPATPEDIARLAAEKRENEANVAHLEAQPDVAFRIGPTGKIAWARRLDVFESLYDDGRGRMSKGAFDAVIRLEKDIAARKREDTDRGVPARIMAHSVTPITDRSLQAGYRVDDAIAALGYTAGGMMEELISTPQGAILTRWPPIVQRWTKETNPHAQRAAVRMASERLAEWYREVDQERPRKRA